MPEITEPQPAPPAEETSAAGAAGTELPAAGSSQPDEGAPPAAAKPPKGPPLPTVEPRVGQLAKIHLPERMTAGGRPIRVMRPGNPPRPYVEGEVVRWDDHFVTLRQEGAVLATEIVEEK